MMVLDGGNIFAASLADAFDVAWKMVASGLETAPALVFGLVVIAALPLLIVGGAVLRRFASSTVVERTTLADQTARFDGSLIDAESNSAGEAGRPAPAYSRAVISVEMDGAEEGTANQQPFQFGTAMVARIGREEDNDIRLKHATVHRYHALIRRSYEEGYEIADLSDATGNGVIVNGARVSNSPLSDGDVITLGAVQLRFGLPR